MLNIEASVIEKFPQFVNQKPIVKKSALGLLKKITREDEINAFLLKNEGVTGFDFIEKIFDYFNFSYHLTHRELGNIPAKGRVMIVANHPIGSLDGLALLHLVSRVRKDVKIVANDLLMAFKPLHSLLLPLDNLKKNGYKQSYKAIIQALTEEQAVIMFPSGEVSRASAQGIRDGKWQGGFLHFARKTKTPLLPIYVGAKNSWLFYTTSIIYKPLATALLAQEMFNKQSAEIKFKIGEVIPSHTLESNQLADKPLIKRLKKHLYKIGKGKSPIFVTEKTIAHPEDYLALRNELARAEVLGQTADNHCIYLCYYHSQPLVLREIGRLREWAFRKVGEGTGSRRDLDKYDAYYAHLVLWDEKNLTIAGAYRLGVGKDILQHKGLKGLYTADLFQYSPAIMDTLEHTLELGRSFVNPDYWGKSSLDYLWQGLGAYLKRHPSIRYLLGPVSLSAQFPKPLRDHLVFYYCHYYQNVQGLANPKQPYFIEEDSEIAFMHAFSGLSKSQGFAELNKVFQQEACKVPVLFKQYAALFEEGGFELLAFSVDSEFANCVDGLFLADLHKMKPQKRNRYIGEGANL